MSKIDINTDKLFEKKKNELIRNNKRMALFFSLASLFFFLVIACALLNGPFYDYNQDNPNFNMSDLFYLIAIGLIVFALAFTIIGISLVFICKNMGSKKIKFFNEAEKTLFLQKFLKHQLISFILYIVGFITIICCVKQKVPTYMIIASISFIIVGCALSDTVYMQIIRIIYKDKSSVLGDIVKEKGIMGNFKIYERVIVLISLIAFLIVLTSFLINSNSLPLMLITIILTITYFGLLIYGDILVLKKIKKGTSKCTKR